MGAVSNNLNGRYGFTPSNTIYVYYAIVNIISEYRLSNSFGLIIIQISFEFALVNLRLSLFDSSNLQGETDEPRYGSTVRVG